VTTPSHFSNPSSPPSSPISPENPPNFTEIPISSTKLDLASHPYLHNANPRPRPHCLRRLDPIILIRRTAFGLTPFPFRDLTPLKLRNLLIADVASHRAVRSQSLHFYRQRQMRQNSLNRLWPCDHSDYLHPTFASWATQNAEIKASFQQISPRDIRSRRPPVRLTRCERGLEHGYSHIGRIAIRPYG